MNEIFITNNSWICLDNLKIVDFTANAVNFRQKKLVAATAHATKID